MSSTKPTNGVGELDEIHLEEHPFASALTADRTTVSELPAPFAPISLENADLYLELQRNVTFLSIAESLSHTGCFAWSIFDGEISWSPETYDIFGYDRTAKPTFEMVLARVHPDDTDSVQKALTQAFEVRADFRLEYRLLMPNGLVKHIHSSARVATTSSGNLELVGAVTDFTTAKQAEERRRQDEQELRHITDAIPQLIIVYSPEGRALYLNRGTLDYMGLSLEEVQAEGFRDRVIHPDDVQRFRNVRQNGLPKGTPFETEQRVLGKDGKYRWFLSRYNPLKDEHGRIIRWYATATDIDDRKVAEQRLQNENVALREEVDRASMFEEIVGASTVLSTVLDRVAKVAPTNATVLITGETGTGKELIARAIHKRSHRSQRAFVSINCAALAPSLISSELFGHEKGAFTGATQRHVGRFELANGGTLFLDEVGELPQDTQIALLRVLQEREFERVGGKERLKADVRIIAATNRDLAVAQADGEFRSDLFYRLNVFPIHVPPLRERRGDIALLLEYFVHRYATQSRRSFKSIDKHSLELFRAYDWPGNIRELQNIIERSVILSPDNVFCVDSSWLPSAPSSQRAPQLPKDLSHDDEEHERKTIEAALAQSRGRISGPRGAAATLGLPPSTLETRIKKLKIRKNRFKLG
jgi:PAS domain S-box-containing protein